MLLSLFRFYNIVFPHYVDIEMSIFQKGIYIFVSPLHFFQQGKFTIT